MVSWVLYLVGVLFSTPAFFQVFGGFKKVLKVTAREATRASVDGADRTASA
jgi:hypothetical protein